jgi:TPR repeat protein
MGVPFEQAVGVRGHRPDGRNEVGSGFLLSTHLVLTAGHVVFAKSGNPLAPVLVQLPGRPPARARVVWPLRRGKLDAALVEVTDPAWRPPPRMVPPRLGRLTGRAARIPCEAVGFPRVLREPDATRESEHLDGHINPGNRVISGCYDVHVDGAPPKEPLDPRDPSPWAGMSGAALFSGDLLIGVVVIDTPGFGRDRLTAVPASQLVDEAAFVATVAGPNGWLELESVELAKLFTTAPRRRNGPSRARLLGADAEVVPFRGREHELAELGDWCDSEDHAATWLMVGPGGQGKTRLGRELCQRRRRLGWTAGFVADKAPARAVAQLADTSSPVLLVVDYAETRTKQLRALLQQAWDRDGGAPIRLLLLARSAGDWWERLRRRLRDPLAPTYPTELAQLEDSAAGRDAAYRQALGAFAQRLAEAEPEAGWSDIAQRRGGHQGQGGRPELQDPGVGSVLTLHMTALTALLQAGPARVSVSPTDTPEDLLLDHEQQYWEDSAAARVLPYHQATLRGAVAAATLLGAVNEDEAVATLRRVPGLRDRSEDERRAVAIWLHDLYPVSGGRYWGSLQPDRLGEHLVARVAAEDRRLLDLLLADASQDQTSLANTILARLGELLRQQGKPAEARRWYQRAAEGGHLDAAYHLGELLGEDGKPGEARSWYQRAAEGGHLDAAYHLGELLREDGKPADAKPWYQRAAEPTPWHSSAAFQLGCLLQDEGDRDGAVTWWTKASHGGDREAAFRLGQLLWGEGNPAEAKPWLREAADGGHTYAAYQLGWLLLDEEGDRDGAKAWWTRASHGGERQAGFPLGELLRQDGQPAEARPWYQQAAKDGHRDAMFWLAELLWDDGKPGEARAWYEQAASNGHRDAAYQLGELLRQDGKPAEAEPWYQQAANHGDAYAAHQLGWLLLDEEGDRDGAKTWWTRAFHGGERRVAFHLGELLREDGRLAEAKLWYQQAATDGHRDAAFWLAELLWGDGRPAEAKPYYQDAATAGHAYAAHQLGWLLLNEDDDRDGAVAWWRKAAEGGDQKAASYLDELLGESRGPRQPPAG